MQITYVTSVIYTIFIKGLFYAYIDICMDGWIERDKDTFTQNYIPSSVAKIIIYI